MKGITNALRNLATGKPITVPDTSRSDIHRIATRVGIKVKCEKFVGGFYVTRTDGGEIPKNIQGERVIVPIDDI